MKNVACGSPAHAWTRRNFLGASLAGTSVLGFGGMLTPLNAAQLRRQDKRVLFLNMQGGLSQLESWDPKPGTATGGPLQSIQTSVPGIRISELLPHTARQMHHLTLVRGINTRENNHATGAYIMQTGRRPNPAEKYPYFGAVAAKLLADEESPLPGHIHISSRASNPEGDGGFLGPRFASVFLQDGAPPANLLRPTSLTEEADQRRNEMRLRASSRFSQARGTADTEAFTNSFSQAQEVMSRHRLFDLSQEPAHVRNRYGNHEFGRHCLLARRLLENGVTFVKVSHSNYDTHFENFDFHIEQLGEFDRTFATLIEDLVQRGLWENTLVVVMSEFGRTPTINKGMGRDHWGTAWSVCLGGSGLVPGSVVGATNAGGTEVTDRMVNGGHLFHTYFKALGLNPERNHHVGGRPIPYADPEASAIQEILA